MVNTVFHFVNDPTFNYAAAVANGDISEYTIVFNVADRSIRAKNTMFGRMSRADIVETLGDISDIIPAATSTKMGGIKIGYVPASGEVSKKYAVKLDENNRAYVDVPWTDTVTPVFDDTELQQAIDALRFRIDNYINDLVQTVQDCTQSLLTDAQWVTENLAAGETGRQINDNIDEYFRQQYGVWDWKDPNDHSKGKIVRTSVIELNVDSIDLRVGAVEDYKDGTLATALSNLEQTVGVDLETGEIKAGTNLINSVQELDEDTDNIVKMAAAALQLKSSKNGSTLNSTSDLASVIVNGQFTGYSGLNETVTQQGNSISAQSSLMSRVVNSDGTPNSTFKSDVISGLATEVYADNAAASAKTSLVASINNKTAGITVFAEKSGGKLESGVTIDADHVLINSNTTVAGKLTAMDVDIQGKATVNQLNAATARVESKADLANNRYVELANGNGTFTGNVNATTLIAGDPSGINIRTSSDKIEFCQGADVRAYFVADGNGMLLHVWDANGTEYTIDFTKWSQVGGSTYTPVRGYYKYNGSLSNPFVSDTDLFKGSDGKYYSYSGSSYTLISSRDVYVQESANAYPSHGTGFNGSGAPIIYAYATNSGTPCAISLTVNRYVKYSISNGVMGSADTSYIYHSPDYPVSPIFSGTSIDMNNTSFGGRFINPQGGSANVRFAYVNGVTKDLGASMQSRTYVSIANAGTAYSTNPTVYDVALMSLM